MRTPLERFEDMRAIEENGCWPWLGARLPRGYGQFFDGRSVVRAHRWSYEHFRGPIPAGLVLDHRCRNTACVNPYHVEPVTQRENVLRGRAPAALQAQRTHCIHGHALEGEALYVKPNGARQCRICRRATDGRRHKRGR
jgi:hypothetical protein